MTETSNQGEGQENNKADNQAASQTEAKKVRPPKPEEKPFHNFINEDFIPDLINALTKHGVPPTKLELIQGNRPVAGGSCWMVRGELQPNRSFWLCFQSESITSAKTIALAEAGRRAGLLESFLIDEKRITKSLLMSRLLQRLNGQKWLGSN